ncbi:MAG: CPBP family intramembrane metalloprotease [Methanobacteriaceae archaeon]|nr:CPBP family intramembrane metalloprotease [Methanobacteriaceae archaeon]
MINKLERQYIEKRRLSLLQFIGCIIVAFSLSYIGNIIGVAITSLIGNFLSSPIVNPVSEMVGSVDIWTTFLVIVILAPIFEELFFRKFLIDRTIKYGGWASVVISATLFAFFHGNLNQFFYTFLLGAFFAYVYVKTGNIKYTIALHGLINFSGSIVSMFLISLLESSIPVDISNLTNAQIMANISDYTPYIAILFISILILLVIVLGIILILLNYNKINLPVGEVTLKKSSIFLNFGMICFLIFYIFVIISSIFV